jgi:glycosyltransferase involved in cell wall biosynthesis
VRVAIVHDYLTQRGGAERVVLSMLKAFPGAPLYTSLYEPDATFPAFRSADVRTLIVDRLPPLRRRHRLALPLLAQTFSRLTVSADVVLCSSSGWAHGARGTGRKVVYCYTPARWLYQTDAYLGGRRTALRLPLRLARPFLMRWDRRAALSSDRYLTSSTAVADRIRALYGIDAEVLPPPPAVGPGGPVRRIDGLEAGFLLCISRLLPYKNVGAVVEAFRSLPEQTLVVVGTGPDASRLRLAASANVRFVGSVEDDQLRWLYHHCRAVVAASFEDYGLTPLEAAGFGKPAAVLRWGGFLDTVVDGRTGVLFDSPTSGDIQRGVRVLVGRDWDARGLARHAARYSEARFVERLRDVVNEETFFARRNDVDADCGSH